MKKNIYHFLCCALIALSQGACTDVVDKTNLGAISDNVMWQDPKLIVSYFDNVMSDCIPGSERDLASHSEESTYYNEIVFDNLTANTSAGYWDRWYYTPIRKINRFLDRLGYDGFIHEQPATSSMDESLREDMIGQVLVMRGYLYFDMVVGMAVSPFFCMNRLSLVWILKTCKPLGPRHRNVSAKL